MRLIPGKIKVQIELFKGVSLADIFVGAFAMLMILFVVISSLPGKLYICVVLLVLAAGLLARVDTVPNYLYLLHILRHFGYPHHFGRIEDDELLFAKKAGDSRQMIFDRLFREEMEEAGSPRDRKKREKEERKLRKKEDKLLKSKKTSAEEKEEILERRAAMNRAARETQNAPEAEGEEVAESKKERKAREKEEKRTRKQEDKLLKSKSVTEEEKEAIREKRARQAEESARKMAQAREDSRFRHAMEDIIAFTDIRDGLIEYGDQYYGAVIEIPPVELRFFSPARRNNTIENGLGRVLRTINAEYCANIVKIERPILYDRNLKQEYDRLDELKASYENGLLSEEEYKARVEILYNRIYHVRDLCYDNKVVAPCYYLVLFESDKRQLENQISSALNTLRAAEMSPRCLDTDELAIFLKYTNQLDFDEREISKIRAEDYAQWAMPMTVDIKPRTVEVNHIVTHTMRLVGYPSMVGDAWLAGVMSMPGTKCVVKCRPMDRAKSIRGIDRSLQELRGQYMNTGVDSRRMELQSHIDTLGELLATLQRDNESLLEVNIYVTAYDIAATRANRNIVQPPKSELPNITNMKKAVRRLWQESGFRMNNMEFNQMQAFIGAQISGYDPMSVQSRGIPSNSMAACYPWIYAHISDPGGIKMGSSEGVPVFVDFFRRDSERVNSNMVIVGKSGSGKSYATKSILENLAAEDCKIFILDPENEYAELASNLHGKFINVGNAQYGRLNPFQIITALDDDETDSSTISGSYATHLQFLEEFFRQILPDCDKDAMEYLNNMIDRMYTNHGITAESDLSKLKPTDYPIFDDLYDAIMQEFQQTDNEYIRSILRILMNYIAKFSTGGRNANIWNGPSTITTDENFTVFNFQSLLANRNSTIANAQMLLVLKYIDNEIIKNRDYNTRYHLNRKVAVVIDEAHVFIDTKFPVALDFMFQLAKRIRKYNGMQIVITQNIKDFVGSEEIARKSTAIINACQYSMIFALAPNDLQDLCRLYEKAGGINEREQEEITSAPRGQAFAVMSPSSRTTFRVEVPADAVAMFREPNFQSRYFSGEEGEQVWEGVVGESRQKYQEKQLERWGMEDSSEDSQSTRHYVTFTEIQEEEAPPQKSVFFTEETEAPAAERAPEISSAPSVERASEQYVPSAAPSSAAEQLMSELLGKFSYDVMVQEIRRTVREEMAREKEDQIAQSIQAAVEEAMASVAVAPEKPEPAPVREPQTEEPPMEILPQQDIPAPQPEQTWEEPDDEEETDLFADLEEEVLLESRDEDSDDSFDIMALLTEQATKIQDVNPIDMMVSYDEEVIEVTLEELTRYNQMQWEKHYKTGDET